MSHDDSLVPVAGISGRPPFVRQSPAVLASVNIGTPRPAPWAALGHTAMAKAPISVPVLATRNGLVGDGVADTVNHGGPDRALSAYSREDLDYWAIELGRTVRNGQFSENLTTRGMDLRACVVGERWRIGDAVLQVASVRTPCNDFKAWMGRTGYDNAAWVRRFVRALRPGPYLRVQSAGWLRVGDAVDVVERPGHGVTVETMFRALTVEPTLLPSLLAVEGLADHVADRINHRR